MSDGAQEIQINVKGPSELKLQITISTDKTVLELKQAIAAKSDVEADRQRLIYSGRVLKDEDPLSQYKIQAAHTIHMVKGAARAGGPAASGSGAASGVGTPPQQLPTMQTGQNVHDPLTQLNSHLGFGAMAGVNPFQDMGLNANDPNMLQTMLNSPQFLQQMSGVMSNPAILDQLIASNPQLAAMGPQVREVFQSERFRQLMSNPEQLRAMLQMASIMRGAGGGGGMGDPFGMGGLGGTGAGAFPAPGQPSTATGQAQGQSQTPAAGTTPGSPGAGQMPPPLFPFGMGLGSPGAGDAGAGAGAGGGAALNPALLQQLLGGMGAAGGFGGAGAGAFGAGSPPPPADPRPPEERFQTQLQQLQDMGFTNAVQNVRALLATGGNVQGAVDYILGGGGL